MRQCLSCQKELNDNRRTLFCDVNCRNSFEALNDILYINRLKQRLYEAQTKIKEYQEHIDYKHRIRHIFYHELVNKTDKLAVEIINIRGRLGIN
jgi:hypothetical protein